MYDTILNKMKQISKNFTRKTDGTAQNQIVSHNNVSN